MGLNFIDDPLSNKRFSRTSKDGCAEAGESARPTTANMPPKAVLQRSTHAKLACACIVTTNLRHFPAAAVTAFGIEVVDPDKFIVNQWDLDPLESR
jgi:hypothetical protein